MSLSTDIYTSLSNRCPSYWCSTQQVGRVKLSKVKVTLRLTVSQSVSQSVNLGVEPNLGLMTRFLLLFDNLGLVIAGRPL
jgi:hypothetical protein